MILLRLITEADLPLILAWRSNPLVYSGFVQQKAPLQWKEHISWWGSRNQDWREFIIELIEDDISRPVGVITVGNLDHWAPEIGYFIGEVSLWGKGIGRAAVMQGIEWLRGKGKEYARTTILDDNNRSIKLAQSLGFKKLGKARDGESWYQVKL